MPLQSYATPPLPSPLLFLLLCCLQAPLNEEQVQALGSKRPPPDNDYNFISNWLRGEPEGVYGVSAP